jgi:hypothetical protein
MDPPDKRMAEVPPELAEPEITVGNRLASVRNTACGHSAPPSRVRTASRWPDRSTPGQYCCSEDPVLVGHSARTLQRHGGDKVPPSQIREEAHDRARTQPLDEHPQVQQDPADVQQQCPAAWISDRRKVGPQFNQRAGRMP